MSSLIGRRIYGRQAISLLSAGRRSQVYKVWNLTLERYEVLKIAPKGSRAENLLRRESKTLAKLRHPNILTLLETQENATLGHLAFLEFVKGPPLPPGPESEDVILGWVKQILSALSHSHSQGVIHRDINRKNIFLDFNDHIKLTGFKIARIPLDQTIRSVNKTWGSPAYMAPEQLTGMSDMDERIDLYSLGVLCYRLYTGRYPFPSENSSNRLKLQKKFNESRLPQSLSYKFKGLLNKLLAWDRNDRFQNTSEVFQWIENNSSKPLPPVLIKLVCKHGFPKSLPLNPGQTYYIGRTEWFGGNTKIRNNIIIDDSLTFVSRSALSLRYISNGIIRLFSSEENLKYLNFRDSNGIIIHKEIENGELTWILGETIEITGGRKNFQVEYIVLSLETRRTYENHEFFQKA